MYGGDRVYPLSSHDDDENVSRMRETRHALSTRDRMIHRIRGDDDVDDYTLRRCSRGRDCVRGIPKLIQGIADPQFSEYAQLQRHEYREDI